MFNGCYLDDHDCSPCYECPVHVLAWIVVRIRSRVRWILKTPQRYRERLEQAKERAAWEQKYAEEIAALKVKYGDEWEQYAPFPDDIPF